MLTFGAYQAAAKLTAIYPDNIKVTYPALGLAGEAGEICNKVKKIFRDDNGVVSDERREQLRKEIGDVVWYVAALCSDLQLDLGDVVRENIDKLHSRYVRGKISGDGDER